MIGGGGLVPTVAVRLNNNNQIADTVAVTVNAVVAAAPTLDLNNRSDTIGALTMTRGTVKTGTGVLGLNGNVTSIAASFPGALISGIVNLGSVARTFTVAPGSSSAGLLVTAEVRGTGGLIKAGAGILTLAGTTANTYTGATTVNAGTLSLSKPAGTNAFAGPLVVGDFAGSDQAVLTADNQIPNTVPVTVNGSGILDLNNRSDSIASLAMTGGLVTTGTGLLTLNGNVTTNIGPASAIINGNLNLGSATRTFVVASRAGLTDLVINALISAEAGVGLVKNDGGVLQLTANNTYNGPTTVNQGELLVDGTQPLSPVTFNFGTLGGKGTAGTVTANSSSFKVISPGSPTGVSGAFTVGNLSLSSTSIYRAQLDSVVPISGYDVLNVSGSVNLGNSSLVITCVFTPTPGNTFVIIQNDGSDSVTGTFGGMDKEPLSNRVPTNIGLPTWVETATTSS